MASEKISISRLKGIENYEVWAIRMTSLLTKEGVINTIHGVTDISTSDSEKALATIRLSLEDGPLLQIQHYTTAKEA